MTLKTKTTKATRRILILAASLIAAAGIAATAAPAPPPRTGTASSPSRPISRPGAGMSSWPPAVSALPRATTSSRAGWPREPRLGG